MEHQDETLSTRDIAGGSAGTQAPPEQETRFERETEPAEAMPGDAHAAPAERTSDGTTGAEPIAAEAAPADAGTATDRREGTVEPTARDTATDGTPSDMRSLLDDQDQSAFQARWEEVQTRFVDDPRRAVEDADALVANVMQALADGFAGERERLEGMWGRGEDVGTEDLRVALQRYRSFFQRLLAA